VTPPPRLALAAGAPAALDLVRATDGGAPALATRVELVDEDARLRVRFDCDDPEPWATIRADDGDLWTEEVVELFLAPGAATPLRYFELELNPLGARFDARVDCPFGDRRGLVADRSWSCRGLEASTSRRSGGWTAELAIPWASLGDAAEHASTWRINLFRIERRPGPEAEHSAWSPTFVEPADFHRPARFGFVTRLG
jgi:hypothetical protein